MIKTAAEETVGLEPAKKQMAQKLCGAMVYTQ